MQALKSDPRFFVTNDEAGREAYMARAREIVAAMQARLPEAFLKPPPLPLEIRATEPYRAAGAPGGFYGGHRRRIAAGHRLPEPARHARHAALRPRVAALPRGACRAITCRSRASSPTGIPRLRKVNRWWQDTAFVEGWALYAERLGKEMGFYERPVRGLRPARRRAVARDAPRGRQRPARKRWTREQAIRYLDENTPSPREANEQAVDRYLAVPGQATAFTVGMLRILEERERARRELGERFDLREFHAVVLENGYVPLWALRENVDRWIADRARP
jgi:uncharacterized protein (DUF885 family)